MRRAAMSVAAVLGAACVASAWQLNDQYLEVRNVNIWARSCFINSELWLMGDVAAAAWEVQTGSFEGIPPDYPSVVALIRGRKDIRHRRTDA